jgi:hypothetical protein
MQKPPLLRPLPQSIATFLGVVVMAFIAAVSIVVGVALFEMSPFGRHQDHYRDPRTGEQKAPAPNLEDGHY